MIGKTISDLEKGDKFNPVTYVLTSEMIELYALGVGETSAWVLSDKNPWGKQVRIPTMIHADKMRLLEANCLGEQRIKGMQQKTEPIKTDARIHYEYSAIHHMPAFVGDELTVSGMIIDRYELRGREYLHYELFVHNSSKQLVTHYFDKTLLKFRKEA